jgi:hypothetical protein
MACRAQLVLNFSESAENVVQTGQYTINGLFVPLALTDPAFG